MEVSNSNKHLKQLLIVDPRVLEQPQLAPVGCASPASAASFSLAVMSSWRSARDSDGTTTKEKTTAKENVCLEQILPALLRQPVRLPVLLDSLQLTTT